jgi:cytochrome c oxidase subunit 2
VRSSLRSKRRVLFGLSLLALFAVACEPNAPQDFLNHPVGDQAVQADRLWYWTFLIAVAVFVLVEGALVFTILKFRQRPGREAAQFHGNTKLEIVLTLIPALILAGISIPTVKQIFADAIEPEDSLHVTVVARQFWWEYRYDPDSLDGVSEEVVTANELHIPTGRSVIFHLEGVEDDVIHSFWAPRIGGTQDVVPGRTNRLVYKVDEPGVYLGQCKEFCGLSHANMRLRVYAQEPAEFDSWVQAQLQPARPATSGDARRGQELFMQSACVGCHAIGGTDAVGATAPDLTHFASRETFAGAVFRRTDQNLINWIADAPGMKPGVLMPSGIGDLGLTQQEVEDIAAYLQTLE